MKKTLDENRWLLIRSLFRARNRFQQLFRSYERQVLRHSREADVDRKNLRLTWAELHKLIDFHALEQLRDELLEELKDVAHDLFRSADSTDELDSLVSQIYHEISILKEEHYTLKEEYLAVDAVAYDRLYAEVKVYYPNRLRHIRNLFDKARRRLERILPTLVEGSIVVRSLYLFGEELLRGAYRDGLVGLYRKAYPEGGEARGFLEAARSFRRGGFFVRAREALSRAEDGLKSLGGTGGPSRKALGSELRAELAALEQTTAGWAEVPAESKSRPRTAAS